MISLHIENVNKIQQLDKFIIFLFKNDYFNILDEIFEHINDYNLFIVLQNSEIQEMIYDSLCTQILKHHPIRRNVPFLVNLYIKIQKICKFITLEDLKYFIDNYYIDVIISIIDNIDNFRVDENKRIFDYILNSKIMNDYILFKIKSNNKKILTSQEIEDFINDIVK